MPRTKLAFDMKDEERVLTILDANMDFGLAAITNGFNESIMSEEDVAKLQGLLLEADQIVYRYLSQYQKGDV